MCVMCMLPQALTASHFLANPSPVRQAQREIGDRIVAGCPSPPWPVGRMTSDETFAAAHAALAALAALAAQAARAALLATPVAVCPCPRL